MELVLLALHGLGFGAIMLGSDDNDEFAPAHAGEDDFFDEVETPPEPEGEDIVIGDQATVTGTDGPDTITAAEDTSLLDQLFAGDGNDLIDLVSVSDAEIDGGPGDDVISTDAFSSTISGGEGDDTLSGKYNEAWVNGDAGDDVINVAQDFNDSSTPETGPFVTGHSSHISGGDGDDTLNVDVYTDPWADAPVLSGGEGEDVFALDVTTTDYGFTQLSEEELFEFDEFGDLIGEVEVPVVQDQIAQIDDFEPGVDKLELDLRDTHDQTPGAHELGSVTSEETEDGTLLSITFDSARPDDADASYQIIATVFLENSFGVDLDRDLTLIT